MRGDLPSPPLPPSLRLPEGLADLARRGGGAGACRIGRGETEGRGGGGGGGGGGGKQSGRRTCSLQVSALGFESKRARNFPVSVRLESR